MRIDFNGLGEGQYVELKSFNRLKWAEQKAISEEIKEGDVSSQLAVAEKIAIYLIKGGYLLDDDNKQIVFPLTEETVGEVPAEVIEAVVRDFSESKAAAKAKN
ncbi:hypothetical protein [Heyndrickxia acidicola]|uniref:Phage protein n=1 Tax=Heyndrickxia acidicola TaxID=209389 RepID=A0ABU6MDH5_9BACI|nr:hypothetical protein [Heyndrickxia acidicola]MED1202565.1 hypothetical protein [Heyndrickxia acidicola]